MAWVSTNTTAKTLHSRQALLHLTSQPFRYWKMISTQLPTSFHPKKARAVLKGGESTNPSDFTDRAATVRVNFKPRANVSRDITETLYLIPGRTPLAKLLWHYYVVENTPSSYFRY